MSGLWNVRVEENNNIFMCCRISENKWLHLSNGWKSWKNRSRRFPCCRWVLTNFLFSHLRFRNVHRPTCNLHPGELFRSSETFMCKIFPLLYHDLVVPVTKTSRCSVNAQTRWKYKKFSFLHYISKKYFVNLYLYLYKFTKYFFKINLKKRKK